MESITCPQVMENQKSLWIKTIKRTQELENEESSFYYSIKLISYKKMKSFESLQNLPSSFGTSKVLVKTLVPTP